MAASEPSDASNSTNKNQFLYPRYPYKGEFTPENLLFNANLQEFAQKASYFCALETGWQDYRRASLP